jgi:hypothetical protein
MDEYIELLKENNIDIKIIQKLENLINTVKGEFLIIQRKKDLFKFSFILYIPYNIDKNTLIIHGNNLAYEEGNILNVYSAIFETTIEAGYDLISLNIPILVPVTSNYVHPENNNMHEFFPMQASRNVVFCKDINNTYYKIFDQINNMINYAKERIKKDTSLILKDKIICHGFSSSSKFVLRYATCFPSKVSLLIAGGFGVQNIIPLTKFKTKNKDEINLPYPVGIYDIKEITGFEFDYENYKKMQQFYFIGENETSENDTSFNFRHTDLEIQDIYMNIFCKNYQQRFDEMSKLIKDLGYTNIEFKKYKNYGHSATPGIEYTDFLINNITKY